MIASPGPDSRTNDDRLTLIAISALACVVQNILHEGLGHGVTAWLSGAHRIAMSTVALQTEIDTRWISANGTLVNLLFAAIFWLVLQRRRPYGPATRYFLVMAMAGNLFTGTGYFLFSGFTNFGDWAAVIHGLEPHWIWQLALVVVGIVSYFLAMILVGRQLLPFRRDRNPFIRLRALCWTPYFTDGVLAAVGGLVNPLGLFYVIASALPSTLGANAGLMSLPAWMRGWKPAGEQPVAAIERSNGWIASGAIASLFFIVVLGRGLTFLR
jgi:hypothetical protein